MDEVHYLADRFRGAVWEEVILQLPEHVALVSLSATVSNAEEFGDWLVTVRGDTTVVVDEHRPVPLWQHMMVGNRLLDLFAGETRATASCRSTRSWSAHTRDLDRQSAVVWDRGRAAAGGAAPGRRGSSRFRPPSRITVIDRLDRDGAAARRSRSCSAAPGCDAAVGQCVRAGLRLTTEDEAARDPAHGGAAHRRAAAGRPRRAGLLGVARGAGARHRRAPRRACCPRSRRPSRSCSSAAWCGRCSPPRPSRWASTCPPAPSCWSGWSSSTARRHAELTPGEYTQLTGPGRAARHRRRGPRRRGLAARRRPRAGRRARLHPHLPAAQLVPARLQHGRQPGRPARRRRAPGSCWSSRSAQFQADRSVVGLARRIERNAEALAGYADVDAAATSATSPSTPTLRRRVAEREKALSRRGHRRRAATPPPTSLRALRPGDVIAVPGGRRAGLGRRARPGARPADARPAPAGAHRGPLGRAAVHRRLPRARRSRWAGCGCPSGSTTGPRGCAATSRRRCATPASSRPTARGGAARRRPATTRSWPPCAGRCAPTPATAATTGRRTPGGPSGTPGWSARPSSCGRRCGPPRTRWPARSTGSARCWASAATSTASSVTARRRAAGPAVGRVRPARRRVPAPRRVGRPGAGRAGRGGVGAGLRVAPGQRAGAAGAGRRGVRGAGRDRAAVGRAGGRRAPAPGRPHPRARPRLRLADAPVGARASRSPAVLDRGRAERQRAVGGRLRPLVPAGARPARPDRRRRRARQRGGGAGRRAAAATVGASRPVRRSAGTA